MNVEHVFKIDNKNQNIFCRDALKKEMHNVVISFEMMESNTSPPVGWQKFTGQLIFDVYMDFSRRSWLILYGHMATYTISSTYDGVVLRDIVRIAFTYASLNGLDACSIDIWNAYLQETSPQKDFIICGLDYGLDHVGKNELTLTALLGGELIKNQLVRWLFWLF